LLSAAGTTLGGGGGQGGVYEDFDQWREDHAHRLLSFDEALEVLRPELKAHCEKMASRGAQTLECPFTLCGLAKLEKQLGAHAYQPIAHACGFPFHPGCPRRCGASKAPCHAHTFPHFNALVVHACSKGQAWGEEGDADLHKMLHEELALISGGPAALSHPGRYPDLATSAPWCTLLHNPTAKDDLTTLGRIVLKHEADCMAKTVDVVQTQKELLATVRNGVAYTASVLDTRLSRLPGEVAERVEADWDHQMVHFESSVCRGVSGVRRR
jgi:hypothetical protein